MASINERNLALGDNSKFQLVLFGLDNTAEANADYMKKKGINFPGIKFASRQAVAPLVQKGYTGFVPCVILVKADGEFVSNDEREVIALLEKLAPEA